MNEEQWDKKDNNLFSKRSSREIIRQEGVPKFKSFKYPKIKTNPPEIPPDFNIVEDSKIKGT